MCCFCDALCRECAKTWTLRWNSSVLPRFRSASGTTPWGLGGRAPYHEGKGNTPVKRTTSTLGIVVVYKANAESGLGFGSRVLISSISHVRSRLPRDCMFYVSIKDCIAYGIPELFITVSYLRVTSLYPKLHRITLNNVATNATGSRSPCLIWR
jgi:hypothetical protein